VGHKKHTKILLCITSANVDRIEFGRINQPHSKIKFIYLFKITAEGIRAASKGTWHTSFHFNLSKTATFCKVVWRRYLGKLQNFVVLCG